MILGKDVDDDNVDSGEDDDETYDEGDFDEMLQEHPMSNKKKIVYSYCKERNEYICDLDEDRERLESRLKKEVLQATINEIK